MPTEQEIRQQLGIPAAAKQVILFSQSSHLDWDWLATFPNLCDNPNDPYFVGQTRRPAFTIFDAATALVAKYAKSTPPYYYSVAEIGFLQAYGDTSADKMQKLKNCGTLLHLCGGGITSPDNLLPHGEAFLRNFLVAQGWYAPKLGLPVMNAWIPDDFGHDSQLPVAINALGLAGAGFARIPGANDQGPAATPVDGSPSLAAQLGPPNNQGVDFVWTANDGSTLLGHWMIDHYCQGDGIGNGNSNNNILGYYKTNASSSPTPYIFVPVGCDFAMPVPELLKYMNDWNAGTGPASYAGTGAWAVAATFDHYIQLISFHTSVLKKRNFDPVPYWLGHYASRPANKIIHNRATRMLLAAEAIGVVADIASGTAVGGNAQRLQREKDAWAAFVPSTHHDYITGTSGAQYTDVNAKEQLPRLTLAQTQATDMIGDALDSLCAGINAGNPPTAYTTPVMICNPLGFARTDVVALANGSGIGVQSVYSSRGGQLVQVAADGSLLFSAPAPSLGYTTIFLDTDNGSSQPAVATITANASSFTLKNDRISVVIDRSKWAISSLTAAGSSTNFITSGQFGNVLTFYNDPNGNLYRYGNETSSTGMMPATVTINAYDSQALEVGPLRVMVQAQLSVIIPGGQQYFYIVTYSLTAGESFVRMEVTGATPSNMSVFVRFPLSGGSVTSLSRGTPYHWTDQAMVLYWQPPVFWATHNFLIPKNRDKVALAAIYHDGMPSWGYDAQGALLGNILRNNYVDGQTPYGAGSWDYGTHTQRYALRVPNGLGDPSTGQPLQEALRFTTPLIARAIAPPPLSTNAYPSTYSLASVASPSSAIITAAKPADTAAADLILRVYQPSNQAQAVKINTAVNASGAIVQTALEGPFTFRPANAAIASPSQSGFTVNMNNALATVRLPKVL